MEGRPAQSSAGNVISEPPPATEFIRPPMAPALTKMTIFHSGGMNEPRTSTLEDNTRGTTNVVIPSATRNLLFPLRSKDSRFLVAKAPRNDNETFKG